jgi:methylenetetrahydrofolate dehydrogenase (NADP+) / methenyltetrahydrofolate cyclohydrolase
MAELIKGAPIAAAIEQEVKERVSAGGGAPPRVVAVRSTADPASEAYLRRQGQAAERLGLHYAIDSVAENATESQILAAITALNRDAATTGIIVQLPLPRGVRPEVVQQAVDPAKDVEGVHPANLGTLLGDSPSIVPCTAAAIMACLAASGRKLAGLSAIVVGRSRIVGRPAALLLIQQNATVTVCHRQTADPAAHFRRADVLVLAAGQAGLVQKDMVKPGAIVIDVGVNEVVRDGKRALVGDADPGVAEVAGCFTPTPGGVGPVTVAMLWRNAVTAWELVRRRASRAR